jgi:glycosyltransferase involved in cell wall biosynthesis
VSHLEPSTRKCREAALKLRILHCIESVASGGVEQRRLLLARHLDRDRFAQELICTKAIGGLPAKFTEAGVQLHPVGEFQQFRPHIIHGAVYEGVALATLLGRLTGTPVIIAEEIDDPGTDRSWRGHLLFRGLLGLAHHAVAVSPAVERYLVRTLRFPRRHLSLINNGVAPPPTVLPEEVTALRASLGIGPEEVVIGSVGRLYDDMKRQSDLIRALHILRRTQGNVRVLIVGEGPSEEALRALASELGVSEYVIFAGYQPEPRAYFTAMDVFAHPSRKEAFGLVIVEAMFARLPVVASAVGGIPSIVQDGETGLLIEPRHPEELAQKLQRLIADPDVRTRLGANGAQRAHDHFSAKRYTGEVEALYLRLAEERRAALQRF